MSSGRAGRGHGVPLRDRCSPQAQRGDDATPASGSDRSKRTLGASGESGRSERTCVLVPTWIAFKLEPAADLATVLESAVLDERASTARREDT